MISIKSFKISTLTPVLIGTGENKIAYKINKSNVLMVDMHKFFNSDKFTLEEKENIIEKNDYERIPYIEYAVDIFSNTHIKKEIREFIKNSHNNPYIPGSSLKGAIRTAIMWKEIKRNPNFMEKIEEIIKGFRNNKDINATHADDEIDKFIFGDTQFDIFKSLKISDSLHLSLPDLSIYNIGVYSTRWNKQEKKYKFFPKFSTLIEALKPNTPIFFDAKIEKYYFSNKAKSELGFEDKEDFLKDMINSCNAFSNEVLKREKDFYNKVNLSGLVKRIEEIQNTSLGPNEFILPVGWGTDWNTKTIGIGLDETMINMIRASFNNLGKKLKNNIINYCKKHYIPLKRRDFTYTYCPKCGRNLQENEILRMPRLITPFPKTRRLVLDKDEKPISPLGWIKVEVIK